MSCEAANRQASAAENSINTAIQLSEEMESLAALKKASDQLNATVSSSTKTLHSLYENVSPIGQLSANDMRTIDRQIHQANYELLIRINKVYVAYKNLRTCLSDYVAPYQSEFAGVKMASIGPDPICEARYFDHKLWVRLPMLGVRNMNTRSAFPGKDLSEVMRRLIEEIPPEERQLFLRKQVDYYFVYGAENDNIPDADNHDTKHVTDAVTKWLPGGDTGYCCRFTYTTLIQSGVKEATIIVIHRQETDLEIPDFQDIFTA